MVGLFFLGMIIGAKLLGGESLGVKAAKTFTEAFYQSTDYQEVRDWVNLMNENKYVSELYEIEIERQDLPQTIRDFIKNRTSCAVTLCIDKSGQSEGIIIRNGFSCILFSGKDGRLPPEIYYRVFQINAGSMESLYGACIYR